MLYTPSQAVGRRAGSSSSLFLLARKYVRFGSLVFLPCFVCSPVCAHDVFLFFFPVLPECRNEKVWTCDDDVVARFVYDISGC